MSDEPLLFQGNNSQMAAMMLYGLRAGKVSIALNVTYPGVVLPAGLTKRLADGSVPDPYLILEYGLNMPNPIPDLIVDGAGVRATLSFGKTPYETFIPWPSVIEMKYEHSLPTLSAEELDKLTTEVVPLSQSAGIQEEVPRRLRRITKLDVYDPAEANEYDPTVIAEVFQHHGLVAVK